MKIRQAKKVIYARHWARYCEKLRPTYYDEERGVWVSPSWHDIPNRTHRRAIRKYFGAATKFYNRHGYSFDYKREYVNKSEMQINPRFRGN